MTHFTLKTRPQLLLTFAGSYIATLMFGVAVQAKKEKRRGGKQLNISTATHRQCLSSSPHRRPHSEGEDEGC
jgi:hypothetical protein